MPPFQVMQRWLATFVRIERARSQCTGVRSLLEEAAKKIGRMAILEESLRRMSKRGS
jgi:hypothetical protein